MDGAAPSKQASIAHPGPGWLPARVQTHADGAMIGRASILPLRSGGRKNAKTFNVIPGGPRSGLVRDLLHERRKADPGSAPLRGLSGMTLRG
jgi:hypothetical protein